MCYIKAWRYDKALTDQIRGDLQLVPSRLSPAERSSSREKSQPPDINTDVDPKSQSTFKKKKHLAPCQVAEMDVECDCHG